MSSAVSHKYVYKVSHLRLARDLSEAAASSKAFGFAAAERERASPASEGERRGSRRTARWLTLYKD